MGNGVVNDVIFALNADFTTTNSVTVAEANGLVTNGDLWIGSTAVNGGGTHINVGTLTSPSGTLTIGYSSPNITLDLAGGSVGIDSIAVPNGSSPVFPTAAGLMTYTEGTGFNITGGVNTIDFSLDGSVVGQTITGDSGGALSPTSGNWNVLGLSGSKTSGSGSTLTVKSPPYADFPATATATVNSGSFITAGGNIILDLPAVAADGDLVEVVCTTANLVAIDAPALNFIRIGTLITSGGGTATSSQIGDAVCLRYHLATLTWHATSSIGVWIMA